MAIFYKKRKIEQISERLDGITSELGDLKESLTGKLSFLDKQRDDTLSELNEVNNLLNLLN